MTAYVTVREYLALAPATSLGLSPIFQIVSTSLASCTLGLDFYSRRAQGERSRANDDYKPFPAGSFGKPAWATKEEYDRARGEHLQREAQQETDADEMPRRRPIRDSIALIVQPARQLFQTQQQARGQPEKRQVQTQERPETQYRESESNYSQ